MQMLSECLDLCRYIKEKKEEIEEIEAMLYTPKNQIISDMPKGQSNENVTDKLLAKKERLTAHKTEAEKALQEKWNEAIKVLCQSKVTKQQAQLMYLRFHEGKSWKDCTPIMRRLYGFWNENKTFREYRSVLGKVHSNTQQTG